MLANNLCALGHDAMADFQLLECRDVYIEVGTDISIDLLRDSFGMSKRKNDLPNLFLKA